jgi:cell division protein FtsA
MARLACLDIGSSSITVAIARCDPGSRPTVYGKGWAPAAGVERGTIVDLPAAGRAVAAALEAAERDAGCRVGQAIVAIGGQSIQAGQRRGQFTLGREPVRITRKHASRAVNSVVAAGAEAGYEFVHVIPRRFWLDGQHLVRNPLGMPASRLEVETHAISADSAVLRNALRCVQDQGLDVREVVVASLAASEALLTPQEREAGVILLDLGAACTGVLVYSQGTPAVTLSVPLGGRQVTSDIAMVLRVSLCQAERLKLSFGRAIGAAVSDQLLKVPDDELIGVDPISHRLLCEVIEARLEEVFEQVMQAIAETGFAEPLPSGIVLTGGGAALPDVDALARRMFALPARTAVVRLPGAGDGALAPSWASTVGLLHWLQRSRPDLLPEADNARRAGSPVGRLVRQLLPQGGE